MYPLRGQYSGYFMENVRVQSDINECCDPQPIIHALK